MADPDQGQELQHQPVGRRRSCALALVAADAGPLPAKGVGSREAQPAHEVRQENFEEDDHIATESRAAWDLYVYFTCYIYMQEGTRKRRKRRGEERREAGGGHDSREIKTKAREVAWWWWWCCCSCCWWWVRFFFFFSAWLYRIKASRSRTLLSAFTQAAEKRAVSRVFLVWFGFAVLRVATIYYTIRRGAAVFFS